ncbi:hypothetical protein CsSME_00028380 [Camellia sinensis var. sinensis]
MDLRVDMGHYCFGKVLSHMDITHTLEIPNAANYLPGHNRANMFVWDNSGRPWNLHMIIRRDQRKALRREEWLRLVRENELEEGETVTFYYIPARNSYTVEFEGANRIRTLQLFPLN